MKKEQIKMLIEFAHKLDELKCKDLSELSLKTAMQFNDLGLPAITQFGMVSNSNILLPKWKFVMEEYIRNAMQIQPEGYTVLRAMMVSNVLFIAVVTVTHQPEKRTLAVETLYSNQSENCDALIAAEVLKQVNSM